MKIAKIIFTMLWIMQASSAWSACQIYTSQNKIAAPTADPLGLLLSSNATCPTDVFALRQLIKNSNLKLETSMVANRGYHNPSEGSFSLFEMITGQLSQTKIETGDFFIGHFTGVNEKDELMPDQSPAQNSLMIESFAWDAQKNMYNFYELRGDGKQGQWFYRGDSSDILLDNTWLHRQNRPQFGNRLRCSACHGNGGPIMKELSSPNNDWWEPKRELDFGDRSFDPQLKEMLQTLVPAERLSKSVIAGIKKLNQNEGYQQRLSEASLQEKLRPIFCPVELNIASDIKPNEEKNAQITIPTEFFVSAVGLADEIEPINISRTHYETALQKTNSHFPETNLQDADHAWLTPVKAFSDQAAINTLMNAGVVDKNFVTSVLSIDMTNPLISQKRCQLLRYVPDQQTNDWQEQFIKNLTQSRNKSAVELAGHLRNPEPNDYENKVKGFLEQCRIKLKDEKNVLKMYQLLVQRRAEIKTSQISMNPRGQILEPGFRVIFPEADSAKKTLLIDANCDIK